MPNKHIINNDKTNDNKSYLNRGDDKTTDAWYRDSGDTSANRTVDGTENFFGWYS